MSDPDKIIRMANQIATFFRSYPHEQAVAGVHDHIRAFWTPVMRRALLTQHTESERLDPIVREALTRLAFAESSASKEVAGAAEVGQIGAGDAG